MPKIRPASAQARQALRQTLSPERQQWFDELAKLMDHRCQDLDWYHQVGELAQQLCPLDPGGRRGGAVQLANALGPKEGVLRKAMHFVDLYPTQKDVDVLNRRGVEWTRLKLAFPIKDRTKRLEMLLEAKKRQWTIDEFRSQLRRRHPTKRLGIGGRKRRRLHRIGPRRALETLIEAGRTLLHVYREVWENKGAGRQSQIQTLIRKSAEASRLVDQIKTGCGNLTRQRPVVAKPVP